MAAAFLDRFRGSVIFVHGIILRVWLMVQQDERSYRIFTDEMFVQDFAGAPHLVSTMTNAQWLDAFSCPQVDPIKQGKKVFMSLRSDSETSDTDSSDDDSAND